MPKPPMEIYFKELTNYRRMEIQKKANEQTDQIKGKNKERRRYNLRFLNFDIHGFSSREKCKAYRLAIMEGKRDPRLEEHFYECDECKLWQDDFDNGTLNAQYTSDIWNSEQTPLIEQPEQKSFEEWENDRGLKLCCLQCGSQLLKDGKCPNCSNPSIN